MGLWRRWTDFERLLLELEGKCKGEGESKEPFVGGTSKGKDEGQKAKAKADFKGVFWNCGAFGHSASWCASVAAAAAVYEEITPEAPAVVVGSVSTDEWTMVANAIWSPDAQARELQTSQFAPKRE